MSVIVGFVWGTHGAGLCFATMPINNPPRVSEIGLPYWLWLPLLSIVGAIPWLPSRFSLRTLLIATTLIAFVLGLIVWSIH
jgi:hypothetical protein